MSDSLKYLVLIFITVFLAAGVYVYKPISSGISAISQTKPCSEPLQYAIGDIDPRFSISKEELESVVNEAASAWNFNRSQPLLRNAGEYDSAKTNADILIRLVYDGRQERTDSELRFRERIRSLQARLDQRQQQHDEKRERFERESEEYKTFAEETAEELDQLNRWVSEKNDSGGFTEEEVPVFENRKEAVEQNQDRVQELRNRLDQLAQSINYELDQLNKSYEEYNELVDRYNDEYAGDLRFTKATYQKAADGGVVTVNQFMNSGELTLILAHELGHALGLSHHGDSSSVMFSLMGDQQIVPRIELTKEDRKAAEQICF
ncbi:MAG: matrixin family metalloprotease [Balneolaceae bacterium]